MRKIRDEISLEIMEMNYAQEKEYIEKLLSDGKANTRANDEPISPGTKK